MYDKMDSMNNKRRKLNSGAIKWLYEKSKGERFKMILLILANSLSSFFAVAFAYAVKVILDGAEMGADGKEKLLYGSIAIVSVILCQFIFRVLSQSLAEHVKGKLEIKYKSHIFGEVIKKQYSKITAYHSGEIVNRLSNDVSVVSDGVTSILPTVISAFVRLAFAIAALVILDPFFAIVFAVAGTLVGIIMGLTRGKLKSLHKEIQASDGRVRSFMQECMENILTLKIFSAKKTIEKKSDKLQEENFKFKMKRKSYSVIGMGLYGFIYSAGYVFALIYGAVKIANLDPTFSYGSLLAVLQLVNNVQVPFTSLSTILPKFYSMTASAERLIEIEKLENDDEEKDLDVNKLYEELKGISIENLTFEYNRDKIFENADVSIDKGSFAVVIGQSGIGKSTLFKLLLGVYDYKGDIYLLMNGGKIKLTSAYRKLFSFVPQGKSLFSGSIRDNITFFDNSYSDEQIKRALKISCADEFIDTFKDGVDTVIGENGIGLSEGQSQRISIARSILHDAPIMLLDEVTSALDGKTEEKLLLNLSKMKEKTIIFITHKNQAVKMCDTQILLENKKFVKN